MMQLTSRSAPPARWLAQPMAWLRPSGPRDGREAYQLRFLSGALLLAGIVSVLAILTAAVLGRWSGVVVFASYLALLLVQAVAVRVGASVRVISLTVIATVGAVLLASALLPGSNRSGQLYWFLLIPLAARALSAPRHDAPHDSRSWRTEIIAALTALVAAIAVVIYHASAVGVGERSGIYAVGIDVALFLGSALGLLYVYDQSVRETAAELRRLQALLSVCAWCRNIKYEGQWIGLEQYVVQSENVALTHGLCPTCYADHVPPDVANDGSRS